MDYSVLPTRVSELLADGSPRAFATLRYFQAILDREVAVPGGIKLLMAELNCDGYVHPEINDTLFPGADAFVSIEGVEPIEIPMDSWTDPEAVAFLDGLNPPMQPVNPDKGIKWAAANKDAQRNSPLVILGQKRRRSDGYVCALVLGVSGSYRSADLYVVRFGFYRATRVLAELKKAAPGT